MNSKRRFSSIRWEGNRSAPETDLLVVEEPLEIRLAHRPVAVTMRTPGHDFELAAGFLYSEGILSRPEQVASIVYCGDSDHPDAENLVDVLLAEGVSPPAEGWQRNFHATSSCGICGVASIEAVRRSAPALEDDALFDPRSLYALPQRLRAAQILFAETGSLHGAALFDAKGELQLLREDVGRHNAVDKVVGAKFLDGELPLRGRLLMVSGRLSFEITQKALMAGIPAVAAVSGASSLAVDLAAKSGMLLVAFLRGESMQIYAGESRLRVD
jgi:FdhD protein